MISSTQTAGESPGRLVGAAAATSISKLQFGYLNDESTAVSTLARLRRGAGHPAHDLPDLWGLAGTDELDEMLHDTEAEVREALDHDRADEALHLAVTLWALHQQSHREEGMHAARVGLGRAVRRLMTPEPAQEGESQPSSSDKSEPGATSADQNAKRQPSLDEGLRKRFVRIGTASSLTVLAQRLREVVLLLRRAAIPLDYGRLAEDLYWWQYPDARANVRRAWGRDFHLAAMDDKKKRN